MSLVSNRPGRRVVTFVRDLVTVYRERDVPFMAGSIAYSAFLSLIPLVLLLVIAATTFGGAALRSYVVSVTGRYLTPAALGIVEESISQTGGRTEFSVFGGVALLWAVLKVFRALDTAFSRLYRAADDPGLVDEIRDGVVVLGAMTTAMLAVVAAGAVFSVASRFPFGRMVPAPALRALSLLGLVCGLTVVFLAMYYVFPDVPVTLREAVPGAAVAAVGWTILHGAFQLYVAATSTSELYGVIGGVVLFVTWLYFAAVVLLLGAATNVVLAGDADAAGDDVGT